VTDCLLVGAPNTGSVQTFRNTATAPVVSNPDLVVCATTSPPYWTLLASPPGTTYRWRDGNNVVVHEGLTFPPAALPARTQPYLYSVESVNTCNQTSARVQISVAIRQSTVIGPVPQDLPVVCAESQLPLSIDFSGPSPTSVIWRLNGQSQPLAYPSDQWTISRAARHGDIYTAEVHRECQPTEYRTFPQMRTVNPLIIGNQLVDVRVCEGQFLSFSAQVTNPLSDQATYDWTASPVPLHDTSSPVVSRPQASSMHNGDYVCRVSNACGTHVKTFRVLVEPVPSVLSPTETRSACVNQSVSFSATIRGIPPVRVTWYENGVAVGATIETSNLIQRTFIANIPRKNIQISLEPLTSSSCYNPMEPSPIFLIRIINQSPQTSILQQPLLPNSGFVNSGATVQMSVIAEGEGLTYRWKRRPFGAPTRPLNNPRFSPLHKKPLADLVRR
jgi:hypothetical protein